MVNCKSKMNFVKRFSIEDEYKKNPELTKDGIQHLRNWYSKQPHLPQDITDHDLILLFHAKYYRLEPTKVLIENYLTCRTHLPEFFANRDPLGSKEIRKIMDTVLIIPLEQKTKEGYSLMYMRLINYEPQRFSYNEILKLDNMVADLWLAQNGTVEGVIVVMDIIGIQMAHALRTPPLGIKKYLYYLQEALPFRLKAVHFMNTNSVMDYILKLMKPFMKKELSDMLYMHPTLDSLSKHLKIEILPNEAGGKAGPMMSIYSKVLRNLEYHRDYFIEEERNMRIDESLRPGKAKSANDLFGIEGSFKKLDID